jgi:hypothetical protein
MSTVEGEELSSVQTPGTGKDTIVRCVAADRRGKLGHRLVVPYLRHTEPFDLSCNGPGSGNLTAAAYKLLLSFGISPSGSQPQAWHTHHLPTS